MCQSERAASGMAGMLNPSENAWMVQQGVMWRKEAAEKRQASVTGVNGGSKKKRKITLQKGKRAKKLIAVLGACVSPTSRLFPERSLGPVTAQTSCKVRCLSSAVLVAGASAVQWFCWGSCEKVTGGLFPPGPCLAPVRQSSFVHHTGGVSGLGSSFPERPSSTSSPGSQQD